MLSIVIPTKNEEKNLPKLLRSLGHQAFQDFEVIVADAESTDGTRQIAKSFGARVVDGGLPGVGRNRGAKVAKGDDLLFLDADVVLPRRFLEHNYMTFKRRYDFATTVLVPQSKRVDDAVIHAGLNAALFVFGMVRPLSFGFNIFVKRDWFEKVEGFDESVVWGEDGDFCLRLWRAGARFGVLKASQVRVSVRRFEKEGRFGVIRKGVRGVSHLLIKGPIRKPLFEYEWGYDE